MSFYSSIAFAYDSIFPLKPVQAEFVESCFSDSVAGKKIIDAGCGTGALAILLARRSAQVFGFDSDDLMIQAARNKQPQALNLKFKTGDLTEELYSFEQNKIDGILCFGNTLVHLTEKDKMEQFLRRASEILKPGGKLLLQIVNYDRILDQNITSLPAIETGKFTFVRKYRLLPEGLIDFETELTDNETGNRVVNKISLYPVRKDELEKMLQKYFRTMNSYGDYKKSPLTEDSFHLVIEAEK
jgi:2-polyprenyl-3-methyl-5-hydroxy-6-metoxy-1,4-benzoquinol methylase